MVMSLTPEVGCVGLSRVSRGAEMNTTQTLAFVTVMAVFVGVSLFFVMQPKSPQQQNAECLSAATSMPLVNTTTGVGMTAVIAECDQD